MKELELLHKQHSENVDSLTDDMRKLERQKQDELLKLGELKSKCCCFVANFAAFKSF